MRLGSLTNLLMVGLLASGITGCPPEEKERTKSKGHDIDLQRMANATILHIQECTLGDKTFFGKAEPLYTEKLFDSDEVAEVIVEIFENNMDNPNITLDRTALERCSEWYEEWLEDTTQCEEVPAVCNDIFIGRLQTGDSCATSDECAGPSECRGLTEETCGTCVILADLGEECEETNCRDNYTCDSFQDPAVCVENSQQDRQAGDICDPHGEKCGNWLTSGLACLDENNDGSGVCTQITVVEEGQPCEFLPNMDPLFFCKNGAMTTHFCDINMTSGGNTGTCRARPTTGESCSSQGNCNALESYCDNNDLCVAILPEGADCDPNQFYHCGALAECDEASATCQAYVGRDVSPTCE